MAVVKSFRQKISETEYGEAINLGADASNVSISGGGNAQDKFDNIDIELGREITEAEYNALSDEEKKTGTYYITDMDAIEASSVDVIYDNSDSTLTSTNVQDAITEMDNKIEGLDATDVGAASKSDLTEHESATNPHGTTASDVGAIAKAESLNTSILEKALSVDTGVYHFTLTGSNYTGNDLPNSNYSYGMATIYRRVSGSIVVVLYGLGDTAPRMTNFYGGTSWSGWSSEFLPLTGGTLTGTINFNSGAYFYTTPVFNGGVGGMEGGEVQFTKPEDGNSFNANITMDIYGNSVRFFSTHNNATKVFNLDFTSMSNGNATIYHTQNITTGTSALTSGSSGLSTGAIYQQYS